MNLTQITRVGEINHHAKVRDSGSLVPIESNPDL